MGRPPGPNIRSTIPLQWQDDAVCHDQPFGLFFPEDYFNPSEEPERYELHVARMRSRFCNRCPVRQQCFQHSMQYREAAGIWGGVGIAERRLWLRKRVRWQGRTPSDIRHALKGNR